MISSQDIVLHADQEHSGIRATVLLMMIAALWIGFLITKAIVDWLLPNNDYVILISCLGSMPLALAMVYPIEMVLKGKWRSGRSIALTDSGIHVKDKGFEDQDYSWSGAMTSLRWYFSLEGYPRGGRERRVQKNWFCLACQLQQDGQRLVFYTYMDPKKAAALVDAPEPEKKFNRLRPSQLYKRGVRARLAPPTRPEISAEVLAGKDGKYWLAERRRWQVGFELSHHDFNTFMQTLFDRELLNGGE